MDQETISRIVKRIAEGKCVLILGPELLYENGESINSKLANYLKGKNGDQIKYYEDDEMFNFSNSQFKVLIEDDIQEFYEQLEPNDTYRKIIELPFSIIINTSPDKTLNKAFDEKNLKYDYNYYIKEEAQKTHTREHGTLIYNIFGDFTSISSIVLTFDDLFAYLLSIMGDYDWSIKSELRRATSVLFIGFNFDKWYFKLLLRLIKIKEDKLLYSPDTTKANSKNFYTDEFNVAFFNDNTATEIISEIHKHATLNGLITSSPEVYVSYAWGGESEKIVDQLEEVLQKNNLKIVRDKRDLAFEERISLFMDRIGKGKGIVVVISDKYLKSPFCMYELLEVYKNHDFEKRIIPIVLSDTDISNSESLLSYHEYWMTEKNKLDQKIKEKGGDAISVIGDEYKLYKSVVDNWGELVNILKDIKFHSTEELLKNEFSTVVMSIKEKI